LLSLTASELERYARHIVLRDVGGPGQQKLKAARVLVIGAGGLGAPVLQYLAAAGVGTIGIVDDDVVSLSNLQRQIIHDTEKLGEPKAASAAEAIARLNPNVRVVPHPTRISGQNAMALINDYHIVVDGSDNFATRYLVSDACFYAGRPLVTAAVGQFDGSVTLLKPFERDDEGNYINPTYRCLFPTRPEPGSIPTCTEAGVLGALTGLVGTLQALEVIKEIVGFGEGLVGRLLLADTLSMHFETIKYKRSKKNPLNGDNPKTWAEMLETEHG
jgi:adenylyltransferase/sulfurtransferase